MNVIGTLIEKNGTFSGKLTTLTLKADITLMPVEKQGPNAPDFLVYAKGGLEIGAAWCKEDKQERPYLSVTIDDPAFPATIYARLFPDGQAGSDCHNLVWSRQRHRR